MWADGRTHRYVTLVERLPPQLAGMVPLSRLFCSRLRVAIIKTRHQTDGEKIMRTWAANVLHVERENAHGKRLEVAEVIRHARQRVVA